MTMARTERALVLGCVTMGLAAAAWSWVDGPPAAPAKCEGAHPASGQRRGTGSGHRPAAKPAQPVQPGRSEMPSRQHRDPSAEAGSRSKAAITVVGRLASLRTALETKNASALTVARWSLISMGDTAVPALERTLAHGFSLRERCSAGDVLASIGTERAVRTMLAVARVETDAEVRFTLAEQLSRVTNVSAVPALVEAVLDSSPAMRSSAACALAEMPGDQAARALAQACEGCTDATQRRALSQVVSHVRSQDALPYLDDVARKGAGELSIAARRSVRRIRSSMRQDTILRDLAGQDVHGAGRTRLLADYANLTSSGAPWQHQRAGGGLSPVQNASPVGR